MKNLQFVFLASIFQASKLKKLPAKHWDGNSQNDKSKHTPPIIKVIEHTIPYIGHLVNYLRSK